MTDEKYSEYRASAIGKITPDYMISASTLVDIFGLNPYTTPNQRLKLCHDAMSGKDIRFAANNAMDMGNRLEKPIALAAFDRIGLLDIELEVTEPVRHPTLPLNGSVDCYGIADNLFIQKDVDKGFYLPEKADDEGIKINGKGIVEIKATNAPHQEAPPPYRGVIQVKSLMAASGLSWAVIAILNGTDLRCYFYERDLEWEKELAEKVKDFDERIPHCDYYSPFDTQDAARINPVDNGETTELTKVAQTHIDNIQTWEVQAKELNDLIQNSKTKLMEEMGESQQGFSKTHQVVWKTVNYKAQPEKTKVTPAKEAFTQRRFSIKKLDKD
jgi:hypothetical protein